VRHRGPDGKERAKTFKRKIDAENWERSQDTAKQRGTWVDPSLAKQSFAAYVETWMRGQSHLAPTTGVKVRGHIDNHLLPAFGTSPLARIDAPQIRRWLADTIESGRQPSTVRGVHSTLSRILKTATVDRVICRNPCNDVSLPRDRQRIEKRFLSASEVHDLAGAIDDRYRALIYLAAYSGLRWGEIAALKIENIELPRGRVSVVESLADVRGDLITQLPKSGKPRQVTLPQGVAQIVGEHIGRYSAGGYVFTSRDGLPLRRSNWYRRHYQPAVKAAALGEGLRFHDLRHTAAALAIEAGAIPRRFRSEWATQRSG